MIPMGMRIMNDYLRRDWELLNENLKDAFRLTDSPHTLWKRLHMEFECKDQLEHRNISQNTVIHANDNFSIILIDQRAFENDSQMEMMFTVLPWELQAKW
jgi:hypothetical protein